MGQRHISLYKDKKIDTIYTLPPQLYRV